MATTLSGTTHPERILRLGTLGEKQYFEHEDLYDTIMLNANLVEGFTAGVAGFLLGHSAKNYIIDPMTYAFALPVAAVSKVVRVNGQRRLETKPTLARLASNYGALVSANVGIRPIGPKDLSSEGTIEELCERTLAYQVEYLEEGLEPDAKKYTKPGLLRPSALVSPYFRFSVNTLDVWWPCNRDLITCAASLETELDVPKLAMICLDRQLLDSDQVKKWLPKYSALDVDGYCLWVSDFSEDEATPEEVKSLVEAINVLSGGGERICCKVYGGYLSALLWHHGLSGFSYGPGYGESRHVSPVGGGLPLPKFYLPDLHQRLDALVVAAILKDRDTAADFAADICSCEQCTKSIKGRALDDFQAHYLETDTTTVRPRDRAEYEQAYATQATRVNSTLHYLCVRSREVETVAQSTLDDLKLQLREEADRFELRLGLDAVAHLRVWAENL